MPRPKIEPPTQKKKLLHKTTKKIKKNKSPVEPSSVPPSEKPAKKSKANRLALDKKSKENGIIYVGHLPYGFDENGVREFFSQYGDVVNVRLAKSKKTGRSKGYGWVEFPFKEVAEIAATSMNNFVTNGRRLVCEVVKDTSKPIFTKKNVKPFKFVNWQSKFRREKNKKRSPEEIKHHVEKLLKNEEIKRSKLQEMNITYAFPGFSGLIENYKKKHGL